MADFLASSHTEVGAAGTNQEQSDAHNRHGFGLTHLYCSLMVRAIVTGTYISRALDLPLVAWPEIHERGGIYERHPETNERVGLPGANRTFFASEYPHLLLPETLDEAGWWNRPYETVEEALERARHVLRDLLARHGGTDDRVGIVTHGGFFQAMLGVIFDFSGFTTSLSEEGMHVWVKMNNASISRLDFFTDYISLSYLNRIDFMPEALIT